MDPFYCSVLKKGLAFSEGGYITVHQHWNKGSAPFNRLDIRSVVEGKLPHFHFHIKP